MLADSLDGSEFTGTIASPGWESVQLDELISSVKCHCTSLIHPSLAPILPFFFFLFYPLLFLPIRSALYSPRFHSEHPPDTYSLFPTSCSSICSCFFLLSSAFSLAVSRFVPAVSRGKNVYDDTRCPGLALTHRRFFWSARFRFSVDGKKEREKGKKYRRKINPVRAESVIHGMYASLVDVEDGERRRSGRRGTTREKTTRPSTEDGWKGSSVQWVLD